MGVRYRVSRDHRCGSSQSAAETVDGRLTFGSRHSTKLERYTEKDLTAIMAVGILRGGHLSPPRERESNRLKNQNASGGC